MRFYLISDNNDTRLGMRLAVEGLLDSDDSCLADIYGES